MANFTLNTKTVKTITPYSKDIVLEAGEKLSDDSELISLAQKTVPAGHKVTARVRIYAIVEEV